MRHTSTHRSIAITRQSNDVQATSILGAIGMIVTLMVLWVGMVL